MKGSNCSRRDFLKVSASGGLTGSMSGWMEALTARAGGNGKHKSCILLWMGGGPSQLETFDPKPEAPGEYRGDLNKPIQTAVPGIQICENLEKFAQQVRHAAIIRGMTTSEGEHARAHYHVHTGYSRGTGGLAYPSMGALVAAELGRPDFPMPNYVWMGPLGDHKIGSEWDFYGSGFLGPRHQPLVVKDPSKGVENLNPFDANSFADRLGLLEEMQEGFLKTHKAPVVDAQQSTLQRAVRLMQTKEAKAFDLSQEPASSREAYGKTKFGEACCMARRLVEIGMPFVEVGYGGWDTHGFGNSNCFSDTKKLCSVVDPAMARLVTDLQSRGLLECTLIVWMGEFGRTPKIDGYGKGNGVGRGHHPKAWSSVLIGGGIKGGQVIGKTDEIGGTVEDRPVTIHDFMATICKILGIDWTKENTTSSGRPVRIVDKRPNPIDELFA